MTLIEMTQYFACIKSKRNEIEKLEQMIRKDFEKNIIDFFKEKGYVFTAIDNKYDPINRYLPEGNPYHNNKNFKVMGVVRDTGEEYTSVPKFDINPWEFIIKFVWWKASNGSPTKVYWHPEVESLEDFYNKRLKKIFKLI